MTPLIAEVKKIALADLRACYRDGGILASNVNFDDFWARDSFFASLGLLESGSDKEKVKNVLELFIKYQRIDGKIPRKIVLDFNSLKYLGIKIKRKNPRPIYASSLKWHFSVDDNLLFVLAFCKYVEASQDVKFAADNSSKVSSALEFYAHKNLLKDNLIQEAGFANWEDTVYKRGAVLYSNCLWYAAVRELEMLRSKVRTDVRTDVGTRVPTKEIPSAQEIISALQKTFWLPQEKYFADSVKNGKPERYFDLAGNVLAIILGVANDKQTKNILDFIGNIPTAEKNILHPLNYPRYPVWKINPVLRLFGIQDYQNEISWSWIEALLVIAQLQGGRAREARQTFANLAQLIIKNGHIHETYFLNGRPFNHLLWKSAVPFAWGAGLLLWAVSELEKDNSFEK